MAETPSDQTARKAHCEAFLRENSDVEIRRPPHDFGATPLDQLVTGSGVESLPVSAPDAAMVHRSLVTLTTERASFDVWATLARLEDLLSDYRRIAPRYWFLQTAGEAGIATGNEYRLTLSDPDLTKALNQVCRVWGAVGADLPPIESRVMDVRVLRVGPWGGETGELVFETLQNHALAGVSSLWILAHDDSDDGRLRVTLDAMEVARWAWGPDTLASQQQRPDPSGTRIINWDYLFERLAQALDGTPGSSGPDAAFSVSGAMHDLMRENRIKDALRIHSGLEMLFERLS